MFTKNIVSLNPNSDVGGGWLCPLFKELFSEPKLGIFRGVEGYGLGDQALRHTCKFFNLAIFYRAKKNIYILLLFSQINIEWTIIHLKNNYQFRKCTVCPRSSDPFYIVSYYIKWGTTSWTYSASRCRMKLSLHL